jgi:hypothetical protein
MSRSPLAYPLNRSADLDIGGAADLQTDIMRFMAILSLCLVAVFALVQSIPLTPIEAVPVEEVAVAPRPEPAAPAMARPEPIVEPPTAAAPQPEPPSAEEAVVLTRPTWQPKHAPAEKLVASTAPIVEKPSPPPPNEPEKEGFTLRFASDAALMRAVATQHVGFYAIASGRAKRMTVSESRVSFWDASTPNTFHEMETSTVPSAVIDALSRTGSDASEISWGVTLPGKMTTRLDALMRDHPGGSLIINAGGEIHWEAT